MDNRKLKVDYRYQERVLKSYEPEAALHCLLEYTTRVKKEQVVVQEFARRLNINREGEKTQNEREEEEEV